MRRPTVGNKSFLLPVGRCGTIYRLIHNLVTVAFLLRVQIFLLTYLLTTGHQLRTVQTATENVCFYL